MPLEPLRRRSCPALRPKPRPRTGYPSLALTSSPAVMPSLLRFLLLQGQSRRPRLLLGPHGAGSAGGGAPGATISNADLAAKLQERLEAKARRDFAASDAIRTELEQKHGIKCTDNTRSWIANDGRKGNLNGPDFFSLAGTPFAPGAAAAAVAGGGGRYDSGPPLPAGAMPTEVLFAKIAEREVSRQARDYAKSDAMRDELRRAGVNIDDKTRGWVTTDGSGRSGTISGGVARMGPPQGAQKGRSPASA